MSKYYDEKMIAYMKKQRREHTSDEAYKKRTLYENIFGSYIDFVERCYIIGKSGVRLPLPQSCKGYDHKNYWYQVFPSLISDIGEGVDMGTNKEGTTEHKMVLVITFAEEMEE